MSAGNYGNNIINISSDTMIKILKLKSSDSKHKVTHRDENYTRMMLQTNYFFFL